METLTLILVLLIVWYISGFWKAIKPKNRRWHAWGIGNQIWGWIDGDIRTIIPYSMPWPFNAVYRHLTYTKYVEDGKTTAWKDKSNDGKDITYHQAQMIKGIKKPIRIVEEEITRLRKTEIHPYLITVNMPKSGLTFFLSFTAKIKIFNPMNTLKLDEFLVSFGNELNDAVYPWAVKKEISWINQTGNNPNDPGSITDVVIDEMLGLKVDDPNAVMITPTKNLLQYLNDKIRDYGMENEEFSLDVGYDDNVEKILTARNQQKVQMEQKKLEEKKSETENVIRDRKLADGNQEILLDKKRFVDIQKPAMEAYGDMKEKENGAWKKGITLFIGTNEKNEQTALLAGILHNTKKQGGTNGNQTNTQTNSQ